MTPLLGANGQLFGWPPQLWRALDQFGILAGNLMLLAALAGALWGWLKRDRIRLWLRGNRFPHIGGEADETQQWQALLFTVSRPELPLELIRARRPQAIALVASDHAREAAETIAAEARKQGVTLAGIDLLQDPDDPAEARHAAEHLIQRLQGMGFHPIGVDVTGGKVPMSLGAFMAAEENGCDTLYLASRFDPALKRPDTTTARLRCISRGQR